jgi:hypothetical protein
MSCYVENLSKGFIVSDLESRMVYEAAMILESYLLELANHVFDFYQLNPEKAVDRSSWENYDIDTVNMYHEIGIARFKAGIQWKKTRKFHSEMPTN